MSSSLSSTAVPTTRPACSVPDRFARLEWLAALLDSQFRIPILNVRFGLDPLVGLVPVVGDFIGALASLYIVVELGALGVPTWPIFRMLLNIAIDFFGGSIPLVGDAFDVGFRSNVLNVALARRALKKRGLL